MMGEVQVGRYKALLENLLAMKGDIAVQQLGPELLPVLNLGNDRAEWAALAGERLCWGFGQRAAVAGDNPHVGLFNLPSSTSIVTVEKVYCKPSTSPRTIRIGHRDTLFSGGGAAQVNHGNRDSRFSRGAQNSEAVIYTLTQVGVLIDAHLWCFDVRSNAEPLVLDVPVVLAPGSGLVVAVTEVNTTLTACFSWRERKVEPSEERLGQ